MQHILFVWDRLGKAGAPEAFITRRELGRILAKVADPEALGILEDLYQDSLHIFGEDNSNVWENGVALADAHRELGNLEHSKDLLEKILARQETTIGSVHSDYCHALASLALVLHKEALRSPDARKKGLGVSERLLRIRLELHPEDHDQVIRARSLVGTSLEQLELWKDAEEQFEQVRRWREERLGLKNGETAQAWVHLGAIRLRQGRVTEAKQLLDRAMSTYDELKLDPAHVRRTECATFQAVALASDGQILMAQNHLQTYLSLLRVSGNDSLRLQNVRGLAARYRDLSTQTKSGNFTGDELLRELPPSLQRITKAVRKHYERTFAKSKDAPNPVAIASSGHAFATFLMRFAQTEKAIEVFAEAWEASMDYSGRVELGIEYAEGLLSYDSVKAEEVAWSVLDTATISAQIRDRAELVLQQADQLSGM
jgi:tetratricopeptide (TPR) repeat protein